MTTFLLFSKEEWDWEVNKKGHSPVVPRDDLILIPQKLRNYSMAAGGTVGSELTIGALERGPRTICEACERRKVMS